VAAQVSAVPPRYCSEQGAKIAVLDHAEEGQLVANEIAQTGGESLYLQVDIRDRAAIREAVHQTVEHFGRLDVLFSNAGVNPQLGSIEETTDEQWDELIDMQPA
jgi:NAD(P)-dependent dehydrogenase (short-subunit alcohol dehydrogenase family)